MYREYVDKLVNIINIAHEQKFITDEIKYVHFKAGVPVELR